MSIPGFSLSGPPTANRAGPFATEVFRGFDGPPILMQYLRVNEEGAAEFVVSVSGSRVEELVQPLPCTDAKAH